MCGPEFSAFFYVGLNRKRLGNAANPKWSDRMEE